MYRGIIYVLINIILSCVVIYNIMEDGIKYKTRKVDSNYIEIKDIIRIEI